ncbi:unnamed protein product, partial [Phaeothamnion confervicola]
RGAPDIEPAKQSSIFADRPEPAPAWEGERDISLRRPAAAGKSGGGDNAENDNGCAAERVASGGSLAAEAARHAAAVTAASNIGGYLGAVTSARLWAHAAGDLGRRLLGAHWQAMMGRFLARAPATARDRRVLLEALLLLESCSGDGSRVLPRAGAFTGADGDIALFARTGRWQRVRQRLRNFTRLRQPQQLGFGGRRQRQR